MKLQAFVRTWEGALVENRWNRLANMGLAVAVLLLAYMAFSKDQIVVIKPETLGTDAWLTRSGASESYKEAWGLFLAQMTGNITPATVDFMKERLKPLLSPSLYAEVVDMLEMQAQDIKDDRITLRFEPRFVEYEQSTDTVFVYGHSFVKGASGSEDRQERTYEYRIRIAHYGPMVMDLDTYAGKPRTEAVLIKLQAQEAEERGDNA